MISKELTEARETSLTGYAVHSYPLSGRILLISSHKPRFKSTEIRKFNVVFYTMTLYQFNALPEDHQLEQIWNQGIFLLRRKIARSYLILYALDSFYVEIRFDREQSRVTACRSFQSLIPLEPYLEKITIGSIHTT